MRLYESRHRSRQTVLAAVDRQLKLSGGAPDRPRRQNPTDPADERTHDNGRKDLNERDTKLVQWLNEAYAKEAELEADLTAHIALTQKAAYKKRLQQHLKETRDHKRRWRGGSRSSAARRADDPTSRRPPGRRRGGR